VAPTSSERKPTVRIALAMTVRVASEPSAVAIVSVPEANGDSPKPSCSISGIRNGEAPIAMRSGVPPMIDARYVECRKMPRSITEAN
jgi:hypothetical protein